MDLFQSEPEGHILISAGASAAGFATVTAATVVATACIGTTAAGFGTTARWLAAASLTASLAGTHLGQQAAALLAAAVRFAARIGTAVIGATTAWLASSGTIVGTTAAGLSTAAAIVGTTSICTTAAGFSTTARWLAAAVAAGLACMEAGEQAATLLAATTTGIAAVIGTATAGLTCIGTTARWLTATVIGTTTAWLGTTTEQTERVSIRGTAQHDCDAQAQRRQEDITLHLGGS